MHSCLRVGRNRGGLIYFLAMEAAKRPTASAGLSAFLVEHEACGSGFDITHPAGLGNGRLRITCRACGSSFEYAPGLASVRSEVIEREIEFEPVAATVTPLPSRPAAASPAAGSPPKGEDDGFPRERIVTAALILFALAAVAFAGIRIAGSGDDDSQPTKAPAAPQPAIEAPAAGAPAKPAPPPGSGAKRAGGAVRVRNPLFSLVVPGAWISRPGAGDSTVYSPTGVSPAVRLAVFHERNPAIGRAAMAASTARFLSARSGGEVTPPRYLRSGNDPAFEVETSGRGGTETALGVLSGPFRLLAIGSAAGRASAPGRLALRRALASFRAR